MYKRRADAYNSDRLFGRKNNIFVGDFWQFPPVQHLGVVRNPFFEKGLGKLSAQLGLAILWEERAHEIQ